jgi:hypothetical protein
MSQTNEIYRVKLSNAELRENMKDLKKQIEHQTAQAECE